MSEALKRKAGTGRKVFAAVILLMSLTGPRAMASGGLITIRSNYAPKETMDRREAGVKSKGLPIFAHLDHAAGTAQVGLPLLPADLFRGGNAKSGTPQIPA